MAHQLAGYHLYVKIRQSTIYYAGLLGRWDKWIVDQESDVPSISFFILFIDLGQQQLFIFIFVILLKNKKISWEDFFKEFCKKSWKKDNAWNIKRLVDDSFVPLSKQPSVIQGVLALCEFHYCEFHYCGFSKLLLKFN